MNDESRPGQAARGKDQITTNDHLHSTASPPSTSSSTAYERILDKLHDLDLRVRTGYRDSVAQCPSHDDRSPSLAVYDKDGKAKIVCFAGCDDELDILPSLDMTVADLYDEKRSGTYKPDPEAEAGSAARRTMTPSQKSVHNLLQLPDIGERLALSIARIRPEFYIWEREQLWLESAQDAQLAQHASDRMRGVGTDA